MIPNLVYLFFYRAKFWRIVRLAFFGLTFSISNFSPIFKIFLYQSEGEKTSVIYKGNSYEQQTVLDILYLKMKNSSKFSNFFIFSLSSVKLNLGLKNYTITIKNNWLYLTNLGLNITSTFFHGPFVWEGTY